MYLRNTRESYGLISRLLHALIAVLLLSQIPIGWYMAGLSDESVVYWRLLELHVVMGLGIFTLIAVKGVWLSVSPYPALAPALADWERKAARLVHVALNSAVAIIPVLGLLCVASDGEPVNLYDVVEIPAIGQFSKGVRDTLFDLHAWLAYGCAALIAAHVLAALKHHFIDRRGSLRRIVF
jgi:cytochrome b561